MTSKTSRALSIFPSHRKTEVNPGMTLTHAARWRRTSCEAIRRATALVGHVTNTTITEERFCNFGFCPLTGLAGPPCFVAEILDFIHSSVV